MTKYLLLLSLLTLEACTQQIMYPLTVMLRNACDYPVQITTYPSEWEDADFNKRLEPRESAEILNWEFGGGDDALVIIYTLEFPNNNKIVINADGYESRLTTVQFLEEVKHSRYVKTGVTHTFTVDNPSLCPKPDLLSPNDKE
jgi:hypothetical protein